jgi:hypothetical protein
MDTQKSLSLLYDEYESKVRNYALFLFEQVIKPYLEANGYLLLTGNDSWEVYGRGKGFIPSERLPSEILEVLTAEVPGAVSVLGLDRDLGSFMPGDEL